MAALVAALLVRVSDPSADRVAIAADRSRHVGATMAAVAIAIAVTQALAAIGGALVASHLTPNAARLLFAFSLLMAGGGAVWPRKPVAVADPGPVALAAALIAHGIGDRTMFVTFAVAAGGVPALAGAGGAIGGLVVLAGGAIAGESLWRQRPARAIDLILGGVLLVAGAWLALSALRLI